MYISSTSSPPPPVPVESNRPASNNAPAQTSSQNRSALTRALQSLNDSVIFGQENEVTFAIDRVAHVVVVRVVNKDTREVVDQIPETLVLQLAEELNTDHAK